MKHATNRTLAVLLIFCLLVQVLVSAVPMVFAASSEETVPTDPLGLESGLNVIYREMKSDNSVSTFSTRASTDGNHAQAAVVFCNGNTVTINYNGGTEVLNHVSLHRIMNNGSWSIAYCIEPTVASGGSGYGSVSGSTEDAWGKLSRAHQRAVGLALLYGAPTSLDSTNAKTDAAYQLATQIVIWEICLGWRSSTAPYACTNSGIYDIFKTGRIEIASMFSEFSGINGQYLNTSDIQYAYEYISNGLANHSVIPSFCGVTPSLSPTHTLTKQSNGTFKVTLTDKNNILSQYTFKNGNGLTYTKSGNTLTVTASNAGPYSTVAPTKNIPTIGKNGSVFFVWNTSDNSKQELLSVGEAKNDPVPAYFNLRSPNGSLKLTKTTNTGKDISGWSFGVYTDPACTTAVPGSPFTTGNDGTFSVTLAPGTYYVKETAGGNDWWTNDTAVKTVTIATGETTELTVNNVHNGRITFIKSTNTEENLDGWEIELYSDSACSKLVGTYETGADGKVTTGNLAPGTYYAKESDVSSSYWTCDNDVKTISVTAGNTSTATFENTHLGKFQIIKKTNTGTGIGGWTFSVYSDEECTDLVTTLTTGDDGKTGPVYVEPGRYYFKEVGDLDGRFDSEYWPASDEVISFIVSAGEDVYPEWTNYQHGKIKIVKTTNTGENLANWHFDLKDEDGDLVGTYITGDDGTVTTEALLPGTYYLTEQGINDPFWTCDTAEKTVTVTAGQTTSVTVNNTHRGLLLAQKETNTNEDLAGWEIEVYSDEACTNLVTTLTTNADGEAEILVYPGTYWLKETGGPDYNSEYWTCDSEVKEVTVTGGQVGTATFTNTHYGKLLIQKEMVTDGPQAGWKYKVTRISDDADMGILTSGADGSVLSDNLLPGEYRLEEIFEEDSLYYCKSENPVTVTFAAGETAQVSFTNALRPGRIEIKKVNFLGQTLADAKFLLEWSEDGQTWQPVTFSDAEDVIKGACGTEALVDGTLTTDETGLIAFENLYPGLQYRVTELEAPEGYILLADYAFVGELPIEDLTVDLTVFNSKGYILPSTGATGTQIATWGTVLILTAIAGTAAVVFASRKSMFHASMLNKFNMKGRKKQ